MRTYAVTWEMEDLDAETPREAAEIALKIQRDPTSMATVFDVTDAETGETVRVDLEQMP